ncbi:FKBP-type peptidyl-prolyl cis-trans isomerase [Oceanitalea stevensii]|uniref:Peptidyl-prolyl cis-trans isomerase n=1 Tax=Oceanitalea stevensii TaxID=2763072 RepID=A0ABR8Z5F2_9MICO|nr:FKBP-type peptidyl-prolyl cis-trans isomerase [Oceanitalea stevensii]MBD8063545.1 FKBP-type peptidyl-prolyl cis-trans isomerase [Oceanitalea stevensii]
MRRSATATTAAALAALLLLVGCSSDGGDAEPAASETPTESESAGAEAGNAPEDVAALEGVTVEGEAGAEPTLTFEQPLNVTDSAAVVASPGDGDEIVEGQLLVVDFIQVNGENGEVLDSTYEGGPQPLVVSDEMTVPALNDVLVGQQVGARVLFASPTQAAAAIMAIEVVDARSRAEGTAAEVPEGVPAVTLAENGEPSIEPVDGEAPTELVVAPTIEGEGKEVEEGDYVFVQYSGWLWDGTSFDSSWSRGTPFSLEAGAGQVIEGWDTGLLGQKVGSQVVMVIPPELGYGDQDNGTIPPGSTLVFVVDILYAG